MRKKNYNSEENTGKILELIRLRTMLLKPKMKSQ